MHDRAQNWERQTASFLSGLAGKVVVEDLNLQAITKRKYDTPGNRGLNRSMAYARVGSLLDTIEWGCKKGGTIHETVPAAYTSQTCCMCGTTDKRSRITQSDFHCTCCRFAINANENASVNISVRGGAAAGMAVVKQEDGARLFGFPRKEPPVRGRLMIAQIARSRRYAGRPR